LQNTFLKSIAATCGIPIKPQIERLAAPTHIVVATPGRLIDFTAQSNQSEGN
jgi:superfamily II DNA/RNA helicase